MATAANPVIQPEAELNPPEVNWLFLDLNSYFASVEQEVRPELRGRPVGVVAVETDTTVCIAASYEAKAFGVKTGTMVKDARQMCPEMVFVEARHEIYVDYHHRIVEAVESCLPVTAVLSIDEMACRLIGRERPLMAAMRLAQRVKQAVKDQVGSTLRSSVGLAPNRYLAKIASDMEKPDGLVALTRDILRDALVGLELRDLPGVGVKTEKRLNEKGVRSMADLLKILDGAQGRDQTGELFTSPRSWPTAAAACPTTWPTMPWPRPSPRPGALWPGHPKTRDCGSSGWPGDRWPTCAGAGTASPASVTDWPR